MLFTCRRTFTMFVCIILEHYYRITFGFTFKCAKTSLQYKVKNDKFKSCICIVHCIQQKHSAWYACIDSIECE